MSEQTMRLKARWVFPIEADPIANGVVTVSGGRIQLVGPAGSTPADLDLGNAAIIPGFVNAHTHLDLCIVGESHASPCDQLEWLRRIIAQRRQSTPESLRQAVVENLQASLQAGTTTLADISSDGQSLVPLDAAGVRATVFFEVLGLTRERAMQTSSLAFDWLQREQKRRNVRKGRLRLGLSPHAPYSTAGWLYERVATAGVPLATHLAELPPELELLATRGGPLRTFLEEIGAWDEDWEPLGSRPADYLRRGATRHADWLVAHGTYLEPDDFWQLRPQAAPDQQRVAVVYCPRSTARFGHGPHPFRELLFRGAVVCLGTDSLASAPSLSLLDELRFLHAQDDSIPGDLLLTMATLSGAWALRAEQQTGSLLPGKAADLAVIPLPDREDVDPHLLLLESPHSVAATMIDGRFVTGPWSQFHG